MRISDWSSDVCSSDRINFFAFERIKRLISTGNDATDTPLTRMISGAGAGAIACIACYPLDLVRTRLTTQVTGSTVHYSGIQHALARIWMEEGFIGLYRVRFCSCLWPWCLRLKQSIDFVWWVFG